ncbi:MAG: hypothetical protein AB1730_15545 [Myxococcota bacterium]
MSRRFAVVASLLVAACGSPRAPEPPHLLYSADVASLDNPFPDARLAGRGFATRPGWYLPYLHPKAQTAKVKKLLDGWAVRSAAEVTAVGAFSPTLLRASVPLDPATLTGSVARLVEVGDGYQVLERDVRVEHSRAALQDTGREPDAAYPDFILARPGVPLPDGGEGLLVVLDSLKGAGGVVLGRGYDFEDASGTADTVAKAAEALGVDASRILLVLPQMAAKARAPLTALAAWVEAQPAPVAVVPATPGLVTESGVTRPAGTFHPADTEWNLVAPWLEKPSYARPASHVGQVTIGTFPTRDLREGGLWKADWVSNPSAAPEVQLPFVLTVPAGAKPAGGWTVVLGGHGLGGRNLPQQGNDTAFCLELAELFAREGLACLGIDAPSHGLRGNVIDFFSLTDIALVRDSMRQMAFDQLQLARLASSLDVDGDGASDVGELAYFGNSMGSVMGATFVSFAPQVKTVVLNVGGAGLGNILNSSTIRDRVGLLMVAETDLAFGSTEYYAAFPLFRALAQVFIDPGDPVTLAHAPSEDQALLLQEGLGDRTMPNDATRDLAAVLGAPFATQPESGTTPLRRSFEADPARYLSPTKAAVEDPHNIFWDAPEVRQQAVRFLMSRGRSLETP